MRHPPNRNVQRGAGSVTGAFLAIAGAVTIAEISESLEASVSTPRARDKAATSHDTAALAQ
eukprot:4968696-Prymnesium_polylepis.1